MKAQVVEESIYGTYVWETGDGKRITDGEGRFLCMQSQKNDRVKIEAFKIFAHDCMRQMNAEPSGKPVFLSGHRPVTDEQYDEQKARGAAGITPDPFDVGAMNDDLKAIKQGRI